MNTNAEMPGIDTGVPDNAVSVYGQSENAYEDFPVLKAFQQYIDAEQSKARKRLILLCGFFGALMFIVVSVFVWLLVSSSSRNQMLNDRILEFVMKEREQMSAAPVVVQPPAQQDASVVLALTEKVDELQKKLSESQAAATQAEQRAMEAAAKKGPTPEEQEISRLKALLVAEREKQAVEREKQHQAELEEYRRKHYPELYEKPRPKPVRKAEHPKDDAHENLLKEVDQILGEGEPITYFDAEPQPPSPPPSPKKEYSIPVDIRGSSGSWSVPND